MKFIGTKPLLLLSLAIVTALVVVACGSSDPTAAPAPTATSAPAPKPTSAPAGPTPTPAPTATPAPTYPGVADFPNAVQGGTLLRTLASEGPTWDPLKERTQNTQDTVSPIYDSLLIADPGDQKALVPQIADSWEVSSDGLTYTFHLRDDIQFHSGNKVTAGDVAWSYNLSLNPPEGYSSINTGLLAAVKSFNTFGNDTFSVTMSGPDNAFLAVMGYGRMHVLDKAEIEFLGGLDSLKEWPQSGGSGPFMAGEWDRGVSVEVVRNPNYFVPGRPFLDAMQWFYIPDRGTQLASFLAGQIHMLTLYSGDQAKEVEARLGDQAKIQNTSDTVWWDLVLDIHNPPFNDIKVREAVSLALNRDEAIEVVQKGRGVKGGVQIPGTGWEIPAAELAQIAGYSGNPDDNVAKAKALLAEAGHPNGFETVIWTRNHPAYKAPVVLAQAQLARVGITATIDFAEQAVFFGSQRDLDAWDIQSGGHRYVGTDPNFFFREFYVTGGPRNLNAYSDPDIDRMFEEQNLETDPAKRRAIVQEMELKILKEYTNPILYFRKASYAFYSNVNNQEFHVSYSANQDFRDVWLSK